MTVQPPADDPRSEEQIGQDVLDVILGAVGSDPAVVVSVGEEEDGTVTVVINVSTRDAEGVEAKVNGISFPAELGTATISKVQTVDETPTTTTSSSTLVIAGAVAGGLVLVALVVGVVFCRVSKRKQASLEAKMEMNTI